MGSASSQQSQNEFNPQFWFEQARTPSYSIYSKKTNPDFRIFQYFFKAYSNKEYKKAIRLFKARNVSQTVVKTLFYDIESDGYCSGTYTGHVYTEQIPITFNYISLLSFPDVLHAYNQSFEGAREISNLKTNFVANANCIGVNNNNIVKIYHSANYGNVSIERKAKNQSEMVESIINIIQKNTNLSSMPSQQRSIKRFMFQKSTQITLAQAQSKLSQYAAKFNQGRIPTCLNFNTRSSLPETSFNNLQQQSKPMSIPSTFMRERTVSNQHSFQNPQSQRRYSQAHYNSFANRKIVNKTNFQTKLNSNLALNRQRKSFSAVLPTAVNHTLSNRKPLQVQNISFSKQSNPPTHQSINNFRPRVLSQVSDTNTPNNVGSIPASHNSDAEKKTYMSNEKQTSIIPLYPSGTHIFLHPQSAFAKPPMTVFSIEHPNGETLKKIPHNQSQSTNLFMPQQRKRNGIQSVQKQKFPSQQNLVEGSHHNLRQIVSHPQLMNSGKPSFYQNSNKSIVENSSQHLNSYKQFDPSSNRLINLNEQNIEAKGNKNVEIQTSSRQNIKEQNLRSQETQVSHKQIKSGLSSPKQSGSFKNMSQAEVPKFFQPNNKSTQVKNLNKVFHTSSMNIDDKLVIQEVNSRVMIKKQEGDNVRESIFRKNTVISNNVEVEREKRPESSQMSLNSKQISDKLFSDGYKQASIHNTTRNFYHNYINQDFQNQSNQTDPDIGYKSKKSEPGFKEVGTTEDFLSQLKEMSSSYVKKDNYEMKKISQNLGNSIGAGYNSNYSYANESLPTKTYDIYKSYESDLYKDNNKFSNQNNYSKSNYNQSNNDEYVPTYEIGVKKELSDNMSFGIKSSFQNTQSLSFVRRYDQSRKKLDDGLSMKYSVLQKQPMNEQYTVEWDPEILADLQKISTSK